MNEQIVIILEYPTFVDNMGRKSLQTMLLRNVRNLLKARSQFVTCSPFASAHIINSCASHV